jgi:hypothetical protein
MSTEGKQLKGLKRNTIDKFYTKEDAAKMCIEFVKQHLAIHTNDLIIEPSSGNGAFISSIKEFFPSNAYKFYDLAPEHGEIVKQDYLTFDYRTIHSNNNKIHIVGNPPFGRQSSLAIKFIKKSCEYADSVSFILPKSFKKDSLKKSFSLDFHLVFETELPPNSFLVDNVEYNVDTVFQIWEKRGNLRKAVEKMEPIGFSFVSQDDSPDISFRRVGVNAGKIDTSVEKSPQSHYFIKFTNNQTVDTNVSNLTSSIQFSHNNTVGPRSISKQELIKEFNHVL